MDCISVGRKEMKSKSGYIDVDLDGTLAHYTHWEGKNHIGEPIPKMVERVKEWLREGKKVRVFTARVSPSTLKVNNDSLASVKKPIEKWVLKHIGQKLPITYQKHYLTKQLWDDRAVQVVRNTGMTLVEVLENIVSKDFAPNCKRDKDKLAIIYSEVALVLDFLKK